ncbi:hypothetical protein MHTCC0001_08600 [Flavobacteriaceae bacterium MHTCC 0001]
MSKEQYLIISKCKKGNVKAQLKLYDLYCDAMFNIVCRYIKNEEDAKDVMQEGFLKAFLNINNYTSTPANSFGSWLKRIIINQCIDALRKQNVDFIDIDSEDLYIPDEDWNFDSTISKEDIIKSIQKLPEKYKTVITLYLIEGYDHQEISQILNIPIRTSRTHLRRGRLQLGELLKALYNETRY